MPTDAGDSRGASVRVRLGPALVCFTGRRDGDMADPSGRDGTVDGRRRAIVDRPWTVLRQVHGADVVVVDQPGGAAGHDGDASVSAAPRAALAVLTADCVPVAFASPNGVVGVAHAGWRGLVAGVLEATTAAMRRLGAVDIYAAVGPCVHAECYAFGPLDLDRMVRRFGDEVRTETNAGQPAFDLVRAVGVALAQAGAELVFEAGICTSCSPDHWSWRARRDQNRQATVVWQP